jgi:sugar phosphate permease
MRGFIFMDCHIGKGALWMANLRLSVHTEAGRNHSEDGKSILGQTHSYRWIVWLLLAVAYLTAKFHQLSLGVIRGELTEAFDMNATVYGSLGSVYFYAYTLMQIPAGMLADSFGTRRLVSAGILLSGAGTLLFGLAPHLEGLFIGRFLIGIGSSVIYIPLLKTLTYWYAEKEFASMSGLTNGVGYVGAICSQSPLALLVSVVTWRYTFLAAGVFCFAAGILIFRLAFDRPEEAGMKPLKENVKAVKMNARQLFHGLRQVLANPWTYPPALQSFLRTGTFSAFTGVWGTSYVMETYGFSSIVASNTLIASLVGMGLGSVVLCKVSDKNGKRKPCILLGNLAAAFFWLCLAWNNQAQLPLGGLYLLLFGLGFCNSTVIINISVIKESNAAQFSGTAMSIYNMLCFIGAAALSPVIGWLLDNWGAVSVRDVYRTVFLCFMAINMAGILAALFMKETYCKNIQ